MPGSEILVLTFRVKERVFQNLSEQLVHAVVSNLLSENEALHVASDLLTTDQDKFVSIEVEDRFKWSCPFYYL